MVGHRELHTELGLCGLIHSPVNNKSVYKIEPVIESIYIVATFAYTYMLCKNTQNQIFSFMPLFQVGGGYREIISLRI